MRFPAYDLFRVSLLLIALLVGTATITPATAVAQTAPSRVFLSAHEALSLVGAGARLLDARTAQAVRAGHVAGAVHAPWQAFTPADNVGELLTAQALQPRLQALGIVGTQAVVVYGDWTAAWGEEGRIFWMLEYVGHPRVHLVSGGYPALVAAGATIQTGPATTPQRSNFVMRVDADLRATAEQIESWRHRPDVRIVDTREAREYAGATPYGETRGGHIPGAVHLHWQDWLDASGTPRSQAWLEDRLRVRADAPIAVYCTGGIRSGFAYAVLRAAGFTMASNYDASMWEWAASVERPLATGR